MVNIISFSPLWLLLIAFLVVSENINTYAITLIIALLHEAGHMLAAKFLGHKIEGVKIEPFGVCLRLSGEAVSNFHEIIICASGPVVNIILVILGTALVILNCYIPDVYFTSNFYMLFINLLPVVPLDGGRILKSVLNSEIGDLRSEKTVNVISVVFTAVILALGVIFFVKSKFNISLFIAALFLLDNIQLHSDKAKCLTSVYFSEEACGVAKVLYVGENVLVKDALKYLPFDSINVVCVIDFCGNVRGVVTNKYVLHLMCNGYGNKKLSEFSDIAKI